MIENRPYDALEIGDTAEMRRVVTEDDLFAFAQVSGNRNPMHLPDFDIDQDGTPDAVAPALWVGSLVSAVIGNRLPGPGTLYRSQSFRFLGRARAGQELTVRVRVLEKAEGRAVRLATEVAAAGRPILDGEAWVIAPDRRLTFDDSVFPGLIVESHRHFDRLIALAEPLPAIRTAVVAPEEAGALAGALAARDRTIIAPILVGRGAAIRDLAARMGADLAGVEIVEAADDAAAAAAAVALVHDGRAQALMKGHLHTDVLLAAVLRREGGLRTGRRISHAFVMDVPGLDHLLMITDAAINIAPDLETKVDIVQNAIELGHSLGLAEPRVGVLSAVETVSPKIPSSLDAALLSKMAERGQIRGGLVDGPLAMDNAISPAAARTKGLRSAVAGRAEILVVPNLDAGNMLAKNLTYSARAEGAGVVLGARVPIILTSRADGEKARLASCAVAALHHFAGLGGEPGLVAGVAGPGGNVAEASVPVTGTVAAPGPGGRA